MISRQVDDCLLTTSRTCEMIELPTGPTPLRRSPILISWIGRIVPSSKLMGVLAKNPQPQLRLAADELLCISLYTILNAILIHEYPM